MTILLTDKHTEIISFLKELRDQIISQFECFEKNSKFERTLWDYQNGKGGGEISLLKGDVFEKAAVNWSAVTGDHLPMSEENGGKSEPFFATGISLITHMQNPHAPTVHMNIRYIETKQKFWFGGGYDLTPMGFPYEEDTEHFHSIAKNALDFYTPLLYPQFSKWAKEYFYIPHRKKERGVGGIFFDQYNTGNYNEDLSLWKKIGTTFPYSIIPIYKKRVNMQFSSEEKRIQQHFRAHYVEFNLLYDRGTKFGFLSGGNPDAILCSMPPSAAW